MAEIIVIGDEILDRDELLRTARSCDEGCPVVTRDTEQRPGGAAAVTAMVRALGAECLLLGNSRCHRMRTIKTRVWLDGQCLYRIDEDEGESFAVDIVRLISGVRVKPSIVLLSSYGKGAINRYVVSACLERGWRVVADPHRTDDPAIYRGVWAVKCNATEDENQRYSRGADRCCVTHGSEGMMIVERDHSEWLDAIATPQCDAVGCGDQVLATIGVMLAAGQDWRAACEWGNRAAGIKCGKRGTTPVTANELLESLQCASQRGN